MKDELTQLLERWPMGQTFDLPPDSNIVVCGAYKGITMELLATLYKPKAIIGFEPQEWAAEQARMRMLATDYPSMVYGYGLADGSKRMMMGEFGTDACSAINTGINSREEGWCLFEDANKVLTNLGLGKIDLFVMNIEGYEFALLPYLKANGWWRHIDRFVVQFHLGFGNDSNYNELIHELDSEYTFVEGPLPVWGYWKK